MTLGAEAHSWPPDVTLRQTWGALLDLFLERVAIKKARG